MLYGNKIENRITFKIKTGYHLIILLKRMSLWCVSNIIQSHYQLQYVIKVTCALTGRSLVRTAADNDFEL